MLVLVGKVRQIGEIKTKDGDQLKKLWVETESPGWEEGQMDLKIEEFLLPAASVPESVKSGQSVSLQVRAYASGRNIAYKALQIVGGSFAKLKPATQQAAS